MPANIKGQYATGRPRLNAPATLSEGATAIFERTVAAVDPGHFSAVDLPLLEQFAAGADLARQAQKHLDDDGAVVAGKASAWLTVLEKASRSCVALSARLRICPQSRFDRLVAGANSRPQPDRPTDPLLAGYEEDPAEQFFRRSAR
jgi:phage terminase small subunit